MPRRWRIWPNTVVRAPYSEPWREARDIVLVSGMPVAGSMRAFSAAER